MTNLCFTDDDAVRWIPRWVATLSDGTSVYQDDERASESAWDRLKTYCISTGLSIEQFRLQFRSNIVPIPLEGAEAVYFGNSIFGFWGVDQTFTGFHAGVYRDGKAYVTHYKSPELIPLETQVLDIEKNSRHLILTKPAT